MGKSVSVSAGSAGHSTTASTVWAPGSAGVHGKGPARTVPPAGTVAKARLGRSSPGTQALQQPLVLRAQPVDARAHQGLHGGRHLQGGHGPGQMIVAGLALEAAGFRQMPHALLEEEGIALGAVDQPRRQRGQIRIRTEQRAQKLPRAVPRERGHRKLRVVALAPPVMRVLGPIRHHEQDRRGGNALDEGVEHGLGLGVDPV